MLKIIFDKAVSLLLLIICLPLLLLITIAVRLSSPGPVIFAQKRLGYLGAEFTIYKFRGMIDGSGKLNDRVLPGDPRVTKVGLLIRATHLDELPQLWNILKGDMSLIGPRPQPRENIERATSINPEYVELLKVRPGLTGPVQIRGRLWAVANREEGLRLNKEYIANRSLLTDVKILIRTIPVVLKGQGI